MITWDEAWKIVQPSTVWPGSWFHPVIGKAKLQTLFNLVSELDESDGGCIVELGSFRGMTAITLALAAAERNIPVYSVDDYTEKIGHGGEPYGPQDKIAFDRNVKEARVEVRQVTGELLEVAAGWTRPVSLLLWDTCDDELSAAFTAWEKHVKVGGLFVIKEAREAFAKSRSFIESHTHWGDLRELPGGLYPYRRLR